jgi:hypothetical protein
MRSETARCLYGFSNAPVSATVTVVGVGDQTVASTIVSERNGWLKLAAYGFTFSEKEIQVKIAQAQSRNLPKFTGSRASLTTAQKNAIWSFSRGAVNNQSFTCTVLYQKSSQARLAQNRANAACAELKKLLPSGTFKATAKQTKTNGFDGGLSVSAN